MVLIHQTDISLQAHALPALSIEADTKMQKLISDANTTTYTVYVNQYYTMPYHCLILHSTFF